MTASFYGGLPTLVNDGTLAFSHTTITLLVCRQRRELAFADRILVCPAAGAKPCQLREIEYDYKEQLNCVCN